MKKLIQWLKSADSDFALFTVVIILANLVGSSAFLRFDLTAPRSYSLSSASKELVKTLDKPVSVHVFFSEGLPAPYNNVEQYIKDILVEYKGAAGGKFRYSFFDVEKSENRELASEYGLHEVQIQQVSNSEIGFRQAWMGLAVLYADGIQTLDSLTTSDGFEYKLTTAISKMISTSDALSALAESDKLNITLYESDELKNFGIAGMDSLEEAVMSAYETMNKRSNGRLTYRKISPAASDVADLNEHYGIQMIPWRTKDGKEGAGALGIIIERGDTFKLISLSMQRSLFGYALAGLDSLEESLAMGIDALVSRPSEIGYITGHEEGEINDDQNGAGLFNKLVSDTYTFKPINLPSDDIPSGISTVVLNGPRSKLSDAELYKIDQFVMRGGNFVCFVDPFLEIGSPYMGNVEYQENDTGLDKLFNAYGITLGKNYILDEECYKTNQQDMGSISMNWAPMLSKRNIDQNSIISRNLGFLIFLQNGSIGTDKAESNSNLHVTHLAVSSPKSWLMEDNIMLNPMMITPPYDKSKEKAENLAVLVEGSFTTAFDTAPESNETQGASDISISSDSHISKSVQPGKIFVTGSSFITSSQLIDEKGEQPIAIFIRNVIDYMSGREELCSMRTKGLSLSSLYISDSKSVAFAKYFNQYGLAILVAIAGLLSWRKRNERRNIIRNRYNPDDERDGSIKKEGAK